MLPEKHFPSLLIGFCFFLFLFGLGWRDFWAPVEPRYAEIVRVMYVNDEWIVPRVNGDLYTDKPILYFWLALLAAKLAGTVNEWTVRFPAALGGIGFILTTYFIGKNFFSARVGFLSAVILATSMRVIWEARWAHVDMLFAFWFMLAIYFGARTIFGKGRPYEILLAYAFMALATLTKGLIGIVLPALLFLSFVLMRRDWRLIRAANLAVGIPLLLLIVAPWFILVSRATDGRWLTDFLYIQHYQRYTAGAGHRQAIYYYLTTLPVDLLPWTIFAVPALFAYWPYRKVWREPQPLFFVLWFLSVLVFFSASDTKRELYLIPLLPPVALLVGNYFNDLSSGKVRETSLYRWLALANFALLAIVGIAFPAALWVVRRETFWLSLSGSLALAAGGACAVRFIAQRQPLRAGAAIAGMMTMSLVSATLWIFPYLERFKSPRPFARQVSKVVTTSTPLYVYADTMNDFNFYLERAVIPVLSAPAEVATLLSRPRTSYILIRDRDLRKLTLVAPQWIVLRKRMGNTTWNLVEIKARPTS